LGTAHKAVPFWRRLQESFKYPVNNKPLILIIATGILTAVLPITIYTVIFQLLLSGVIFKYAFSCLDNTAHGNFTAPDLTGVFEGGLDLIGKIIIILVLLGGTVAAAFYYVGPISGGIAATVMMLSLPAVFIRFAITDNLLEALNPAGAFKLISAIGLPYGLLLAFMMIMMSSVSIISSLFAGNFSIIGTAIQSAVSNYYTIVAFHIMGYMIYQYQSEIGFSADEDAEDSDTKNNSRDNALHGITVALKEGNYDKTRKLFSAAVKIFPDDNDIYSKCFDFLYASNNVKNITRFSDTYLDFLIRSNRNSLLPATYQRTLKLDQSYMPSSPRTRHLLAKVYFDKANFKATVKLLNGMHKQHLEYPGISEAYELLADSVQHIPTMKAKAPQCRALAEKLKKYHDKMKASGLDQPVIKPEEDSDSKGAIQFIVK
jgi:tetratricopeptide (TPR) repeat protein